MLSRGQLGCVILHVLFSPQRDNLSRFRAAKPSVCSHDSLTPKLSERCGHECKRKIIAKHARIMLSAKQLSIADTVSPCINSFNRLNCTVVDVALKTSSSKCANLFFFFFFFAFARSGTPFYVYLHIFFNTKVSSLILLIYHGIIARSSTALCMTAHCS